MILLLQFYLFIFDFLKIYFRKKLWFGIGFRT